jgi:hypothetical protein
LESGVKWNVGRECKEYTEFRVRKVCVVVEGIVFGRKGGIGLKRNYADFINHDEMILMPQFPLQSGPLKHIKSFIVT